MVIILIIGVVLLSVGASRIQNCNINADCETYGPETHCNRCVSSSVNLVISGVVLLTVGLIMACVTCCVWSGTLCFSTEEVVMQPVMYSYAAQPAGVVPVVGAQGQIVYMQTGSAPPALYYPQQQQQQQFAQQQQFPGQQQPQFAGQQQQFAQQAQPVLAQPYYSQQQQQPQQPGQQPSAPQQRQSAGYVEFEGTAHSMADA